MQLVILAAGRARRFGRGLVPLAALGPDGERVMDHTIAAAWASGYSGIVVVVREEMLSEVVAHLIRHRSGSARVDVVCQPPVGGTAQAVLAARPAIRGPFGVANADDLYRPDALGLLASHLERRHAEAQHLLVAFQLGRTVLDARPVIRELCALEPAGGLAGIAEYAVGRRGDGRFDARPLAPNDARVRTRLDDLEARVLAAEEPTSMNLWGFQPRFFGHLAAALVGFDPSVAPRPELSLADVVDRLVSSGQDGVTVLRSGSRCVGVTRREDLAAIAAELADGAFWKSATGPAPGR